jgi:uncharacterized protein (TIGR03435 family)
VIKICAALLFTALGACTGSGQVAPNPRSFEVASVRRNVSPNNVGSRMTDAPGGIRYSNVLLFVLIARAYKVKGYQVVGPSWLFRDRYDVMATMPEGAAKEQIPVMLQNLLAERFRISVHRETRVRPAYTLVVGKDGPILKKLEAGGAEKLGFSSTGRVQASTLTDLCSTLSALMDRPVVDMTGIEGRFDITLDVSMDDLSRWQRLSSTGAPGPRSEISGSYAPAPETNPSPSLFTAVKELGLKLESRRAPIEYIIVDTADRNPTEN